MLEKLDDIQWDKLWRTSGRPATHIPRDIRRLLSRNKKEREKAEHSLSWGLESLGVLGTATPAAIPFLIELLEHDETPDKHHILHLLLNCLIRSEATLEEMENPRIQLEVEVGQLITQGLDVYIQHLTHPDWETRCAAILLLVEGNFPKSKRQKRKVIYETYKTQEQHPEIRQYFEDWDRFFASVDSSSGERSDDEPSSSTT